MSQRMEATKHTTVITSDQPIHVIAGETGGHWFRIFRAIVDGGHWAKLSPSAAKILIVLARHVNDEMRSGRGDWLAWPSVSTLMRLAGTGRSMTFMAITELEQAGLLRRQISGGGSSSNVYKLLEPVPVQSTGPVQRTGPHPSDGARAPRPMHRTRSREIEVERLKTTTDDDVLRILESNGFRAADAKRLAGHTNATLEQVTAAIANADHVESQGKLKDRRAYIRTAIVEGHAELDAVTRARRQAEKRARANERETATAAAERERRQREREREQSIERVLVGLSDDELQRYMAAVLRELEPGERERLSRKDPRTNGRLRAAIFERVGH